MELLKGILPDTWYKVLVYTGIIGLYLGLTADVKGVTNEEVIRFSLGLFLLGIGVWIDRATQIIPQPPSAYTGRGGYWKATVWKPGIIGVIFDLAGLALILSVVIPWLRSLF